ncbi:uncharacterized protein LOC119310327 isoform X1 [Triticum dicoccoides]|uniref:uncharacterized protein LOC119310327 isoform X1 n=2 Tax=Triticum dicoccoides TaxID=85692 RepID=UPI000E7D0A26|nr:uncharacterized protein LOC119310327 isoform X1 [Triticum dicoccoides]
MQVLEARPIAMAGPVELQASLSIAEAEVCCVGDRAHVGESVGFPPEEGDFNVCSEATSGWTRRVRIGKAPAQRKANPNRKSALEISLRAFVTKRNGNVVNPEIGTSFSSVDEAYEFYNLYSCGLMPQNCVTKKN